MNRQISTSRVIFTICLLLVWSASAALSVDTGQPPPAQIAAAPARVTLDISKGRAGGSVRVFNLGTSPVTINTQLSHWTMDNNNRVQVIAPTSQSLDQWLIVNPISFTIPPGKHQVVRYSVRPKSKPDDGEHRAMIFFNQTNSNANNGSIAVNFRMGVAIYGNAGQISRAGKVHNLSINYRRDAAQLSADIESLGNANVRFEGQISVWPRSQFPGDSSIALYDLSEKGWNAPGSVVAAGSLSSIPVLPGSRRVVTTRINLPNKPGEYVAYVNGVLGDQSIRRPIAFRIP